MSKKRGLGRGLDALLSSAAKPAKVSIEENESIVDAVGITAAEQLAKTDNKAKASAEPLSAGNSSADSDACTNKVEKEELKTVTPNDVLLDRSESDQSLKHLPVEFLQRGRYQPRREMDDEALQELAASIKTQGIMQPIVVRPVSDQRYEIVAGERRWRACQIAGLSKIPCLIRDLPDESAIAMALIENIQREDLNPIEEAAALQRLQQEFELTHQEVAETVGKSRTAVTNLLRLMQLEGDVKRLLENGDLEMGHARALLALDAARQVIAARQVVSKGLSVRQTEAYVKQLQKPKSTRANSARPDPDIHRLEQRLAETLGAPVEVKHGSSGRGMLTIKYTSLDELDGILAHIK